MIDATVGWIVELFAAVGAPFSPLLTPFGEILVPLTTLLRFEWAGLIDLVTDPGQLVVIFVWSPSVSEVTRHGVTQSVGLAVLEAAPILGVAGALAFLAGAGTLCSLGSLLESVEYSRAGAWDLGDRVASYLSTPAGATDAFLGTVAVTLTLLYLPRLPVHAQLTQRYLFPVYFVAIVGLGNSAHVRALLRRHGRLAVWACTATVLIGSQLLLLYLGSRRLGLGEAIQFHGLLHLVVGLLLVGWTPLWVRKRRFGRTGAVLAGGATGLTAVFYLFYALDYHASQRVATSHLLPLVRVLAEALPLVG